MNARTPTVAHSYDVRICHWINLVACVYLLWSGVHIFLDFPELYWGHTGYRGHPAAFRLADWDSMVAIWREATAGRSACVSNDNADTRTSSFSSRSASWTRWRALVKAREEPTRISSSTGTPGSSGVARS